MQNKIKHSINVKFLMFLKFKTVKYSFCKKQMQNNKKKVKKVLIL